MADDRKYGKVTTERGEFHDGEPVFIFRAQDPIAWEAMEHYAMLCDQAGCGIEHVEMIRDQVHLFLDWSEKHPDKVKDKPGPLGQLPS
jgi:hypothetical protein